MINVICQVVDQIVKLQLIVVVWLNGVGIYVVVILFNFVVVGCFCGYNCVGYSF